MENKEKTCDPRHSSHFVQLYTWPQWKCGWMATCETSEPSPESPAPWPDELSNPSFRCCSLQLPLLIIISPGTGLIARSTHLFHWAEEHRRLPSNSTSHPSSWLLAPDFP